MPKVTTYVHTGFPEERRPQHTLVMRLTCHSGLRRGRLGWDFKGKAGNARHVRKSQHVANNPLAARNMGPGGDGVAGFPYLHTWFTCAEGSMRSIASFLKQVLLPEYL